MINVFLRPQTWAWFVVIKDFLLHRGPSLAEKHLPVHNKKDYTGQLCQCHPDPPSVEVTGDSWRRICVSRQGTNMSRRFCSTIQLTLILACGVVNNKNTFVLTVCDYPMSTIREQMTLLLSKEEYTARDLSQAVRIPEKDVYHHLFHIARSMVRHKQNLVVIPSECLSCGYVFEDRKRFTRPGRCPKCKSERIEGPRYCIA